MIIWHLLELLYYLMVWSFTVDLHSHCSLIEDSLAVLENLCNKADLEKAKLEEARKLEAHEANNKRLLADFSG